METHGARDAPPRQPQTCDQKRIGDEKAHCHGRHADGVRLLTGVEAALGRQLSPEKSEAAQRVPEPHPIIPFPEIDLP